MTSRTPEGGRTHQCLFVARSLILSPAIREILLNKLWPSDIKFESLCAKVWLSAEVVI